MRFVKPLDETTLLRVFSSFDKIITVEDGVITGVSEVPWRNSWPPPIALPGLPSWESPTGLSNMEPLINFTKYAVLIPNLSSGLHLFWQGNNFSLLYCVHWFVTWQLIGFGHLSEKTTLENPAIPGSDHHWNSLAEIHQLAHR